MLFDVFICHASEDKDEFVRPLAERLKENHIEVWYDEFSLKVGDSLRRSIDIGLAKSRYGIVVLSKNFFSKQWPQWELDGLVQMQNEAKTNLILPIWHNISKKEVLTFSPPLADKVAIRSAKGLNYVVSQLLKTIQPEGSTLLIARDRLLQFGYEPPVVTDDWWLDVVEFSASNDMEGTFQEAMGWGWWGFPLPPKGEKPVERGERLARAAMQMLWQNKAETLRISQITHPSQILEFIRSRTGLSEACHAYLLYLAAYAPQLTIRGLGGEFEEEFEAWYQYSMTERGKRRRAGDHHGSGLTTNGLHPACDEPVAFRHPTFGDYEPKHIAGWFVQGELMGPPVKVYETIDYIVWFLSDQSSWMPKKIHQFLLEGLRNWAVWVWFRSIPNDYDFGFEPNPSTGSLFHALVRARRFSTFKLTKKCMTDIKTRFAYTVNLLKLNETADILAQRFVAAGFIEAWFRANREKGRRQDLKDRNVRI
jgi:hypothetical protein